VGCSPTVCISVALGLLKYHCSLNLHLLWRFEVLQPLGHKVNHLSVDLLDISGLLSGVGETPFIPVVNGTGNELKGAEDGIFPRFCVVLTVRSIWSPRISFSIDECQAVSGNVKISENIHSSDVW